MKTIEILGIGSMLFVIWFTWRAYTGDQSGSGQTRRESIIEAWVNIAIGMSANLVANVFLIPLMTDGAHLSAANNFWGGWIYTSISILRQYAIRRWANDGIKAGVRRVALLLARTKMQ